MRELGLWEAGWGRVELDLSGIRYRVRFDWNLWFASLGAWTEYPTVPRTEELLLTDDRDVLGLLVANRVQLDFDF